MSQRAHCRMLLSRVEQSKKCQAAHIDKIWRLCEPSRSLGSGTRVHDSFGKWRNQHKHSEHQLRQSSVLGCLMFLAASK
jgi:hypothetical protein